MERYLICDIDDTLVPSLYVAVHDMYDPDVAQEQYNSKKLEAVFVTYNDYLKFKANYERYRKLALDLVGEEFVYQLLSLFKSLGVVGCYLVSQLPIDRFIENIAYDVFGYDNVMLMPEVGPYERIDLIAKDLKDTDGAYVFDDHPDTISYADTHPDVVPVCSVRPWNDYILDTFRIDWRIVDGKPRINEIKIG